MSDAAKVSRKRPIGLGRGLSALMGDAAPGGETTQDRSTSGGGHRVIDLADIGADPDQPRRHFDDAALDELAASIAARGLIQPIVVRPHQGGYRIVAGERRWRAAQRAHLHQVPVIVRDYDDNETLEIALLENIQREDLNAIEEADGYRKLMQRFGYNQDDLGKLVHKSRSHVANLLRLLELPEAVREAVADGRLSMGHARALVTAKDPEALARTVIERGLSVRETERLAKSAKDGITAKPAKPQVASAPDADVAALERQLADILGLKVRITHAGMGGTVTLGYSTLDQLDLICQRLTGERI